MRPVPLATAVLVAAFVIVRRHRLGRPARAFGALAAVGAALVGLGLVPVPDLVTFIERAGQALGPYVYPVVGVLSFLETGAFVGLIVPGETTVLVGGVVAGQGEADPLVLIALVWACSVAGDLVSYGLGRRLGRTFLLRHGPRLKITEERLVRVEGFFERRGGVTLLVGRFIGVVRALMPFVAGASRMPLRKFLPYDVLGAGAWATLFVGLGYLFWRSLDTVERYVGRGILGLCALVALVVGLVYARRLVNQADERRRAAAWLEDKPVLRGLVPLGRRVLGPAQVVLAPGAHGLELATLLAVATVGAFAFVALGVEVAVDRPLVAGDAAAADLADALRARPVERVVARLTDLGSLPVTALLTALTALVAGRRARPREAAAIVAGLVITWFLVRVAKAAEARPRPADAFTETIGLSYPSGHSAYAVALVACAVVLVRGTPPRPARLVLVGVAIGLALFVGASRVYLRVHYVSDVLGGFGVGAAVFALCALVGLGVGRVRHNEPRA